KCKQTNTGGCEGSRVLPMSKERDITLRNLISVLRHFAVLTFLLCCANLQADTKSWSQLGGNAQHTGMVSAAGQTPNVIRADILYDTHAGAEMAAYGELLIHYQSALADRHQVIMEFKSGRFTGPTNWGTQTWGEKCFEWIHGKLTKKWIFQSDWKPVPYGA